MKRVLFIFLSSWLLLSCARVGSPVGGVKDSIPPKVTGSNIDSARVNIPRDIRELRIDFDEYIKLKDINKHLIISPPIKKMTKILPSGMANKYLLIKWQDTLQENTTYNFNFGNAIVDNNEENPLEYYNFAFSTGALIDSLFISGEVKNIFKSKTANSQPGGLIVGLYQESDSLNYRQKPYYVTKVDLDGYYELNYLSEGEYRIIAFEDANTNSVYDIGKEKIGFLKDKVKLDRSISGLNINIYPSKKSVKHLETKEYPGGILMTFEGNPQNIQIKSLNDQLPEYKITHQPTSDSAFIWFDAVKQNIGISNNENLKFAIDNGIKKDTVSLFYRHNSKNEMTLNNLSGNLLPPNQDLTLQSQYFIENIQPEQWTLVSDSIKQAFTAHISENNPFEVVVKSDFKEGEKYSLTIPKETASSFFDALKTSKRFDFEIDKTEKYGSLLLTITQAPKQKFWLQLLTDNGDIAYSRYTTESKLEFKMLKPGKYDLRLLVDENENGIWDSADFINQIFAEPLFIFDKKIEIRPLWEIRENWDLALPATDADIENTSNTENIPPQKDSLK